MIDNEIENRSKVLSIVKAHPWALQLHGFYMDLQEKAMRFDVIMSFEIVAEEGASILTKEVSEAFPGYDVHIAPDVDLG